jgi:hypothetical protein
VIWDDPPQSAWDSLSPVQQAGILCNNPRFHQFLEAHGHPMGNTERPVERAAAHVRLICGVKSRAHLVAEIDPSALRKWRDLSAKFHVWNQALDEVK